MGTFDNFIMAGGYNGSAYVANTGLWNGSSWTEINDLSLARGRGSNSGSSISGLMVTGASPPTTAVTEEWTVPEANSTITVS